MAQRGKEAETGGAGEGTSPAGNREGLGEVWVAELMDPLPLRLGLHHSVAAARELMYAAGVSFMVVVAPVTGKFLGVVLRRTLEQACLRRGHDPERCPLVRHLKTDIDFCLDYERLGEVFGGGATSISAPGQGRGTPELRRRNALPVIVVDNEKVPVGLLSRKVARRV